MGNVLSWQKWAYNVLVLRTLSAHDFIAVITEGLTNFPEPRELRLSTSDGSRGSRQLPHLVHRDVGR
jgi:hypothetical protein